MHCRCAVALSLLIAAAPVMAQQPGPDGAAVRAVASSFGRALAAGDSVAALALLHPDVVIFEGGAWESLEDYRKGHLSADMRALQGRTQETVRDQVTLNGDLALITREYRTTGADGVRTGAETMLLLRTANGWKIRHIHWSSRARRSPGPGAESRGRVRTRSHQAVNRLTNMRDCCPSIEAQFERTKASRQLHQFVPRRLDQPLAIS